MNSGHFLLKNSQWVIDKLEGAMTIEIDNWLQDQGALRRVFHGAKYYHLYPQVVFNTKLRKHKPGHFIAHAWGDGLKQPKLWKRFQSLAVKEINRISKIK